MLLTLLTAALLPTQPQVIRSGQFRGGPKNVLLSPEARLSRAKLVFKGEAVNGLGGTRTRTWFQKNTDALDLSGNDLFHFSGGIATMGTQSACYLSFAATPGMRYLVSFIGDFRCTTITTLATDTKGKKQGGATVSIDSGETVVMIPIKANETKMVAFLSFPKGGDAKCDLERAEVTEVK